MSTTASKPATTPIPGQLSAPECTALILPHLSRPQRRPKGNLGSYRGFNLTLWVLYTGRHWKCWPVPTDLHGHPASHDTIVDKVGPDGRMMERSGRRVSPVWRILLRQNSSLCAGCMATGPTPWPKKG